MKKELLVKAFKTALVLVAINWAVYIIDLLFFDFVSLGIHPRNADGILGVFFAPFLHANFFHVLSNTLPLFLLSLLLFVFYPKISWGVLILSILIGGLGVWLIGRAGTEQNPIYHVGASGLIYAIAAFLITAGFLSKSFKALLLALFVIIVYGSLVWGMFPSVYRSYISWEGHLMGAAAGVLIAFVYFKKIKPAQKADNS